ncbi:hypothetical protein [Mycolicibacterium thermoresistibile]
MTVRAPRWWLEFVGPETTPTGTAVTLSLAGLGAVLGPGRLAGRRLPTGRALAVSAMAADLWGGLWVNNTAACARWYERPGQTDADHLVFAAAHLHPFVVAWIDGPATRRVPRALWAAGHYGYLMAATALLRRARRRRRVSGWLLTGGGVLLDAALGPSPAVRWFAPVFYGKLLLGHASAALWRDEVLAGDRSGHR